MHIHRFATAIVGALAAAACSGSGNGNHLTVYTTAELASGTYRATGAAGYAPADEAKVLAITAQLDRTAGQLVFTLADGSRKTLAFSPRPRDAWQPDCFTMTSHVLDEVADLSPAPLQLESLAFATPLVFAKCGPRRMILADAPDGSSSSWLSMDLQ